MLKFKQFNSLSEEDLQELSKQTLGKYIQKANLNYGENRADREYYRARSKRAEGQQEDNARRKAWKREDGIKAAVKRLTKEDLDQMSSEEINKLVENVEQLDELSKQTLGNYVQKAHHSAAIEWHTLGANRPEDERKKHIHKAIGREMGIQKAIKRLTKEDLDNMDDDAFLALCEDCEQLDELSKQTLGSYAKKALKDYGHDKFMKGTATARGDVKGQLGALVHSVKRKKGIEKAISKLAEETFEGLVEFVSENASFLNELTEEQLNEISAKLAGSYARKVLKSGEHKDSDNRDTGLYRATKRIAQEKSSAALRSTVNKLGNQAPSSRKPNHNPYAYDAARTELRDHRGEHHFAGRVSRVGKVRDVDARTHKEDFKSFREGELIKEGKEHLELCARNAVENETPIHKMKAQLVAKGHSPADVEHASNHYKKLKVGARKDMRNSPFSESVEELITEGKDIGGGFKHVPYEKIGEGPITGTALSKEQMKHHGIPSHSKEGEYGRAVQIHHPQHGSFHVYQRDYDERKKEHHISVRPVGGKGNAEHLARHLSGKSKEGDYPFANFAHAAHRKSGKSPPESQG